MKVCDDRWREELADHILGSPSSAALKEHLEKCAVCSAAVQEGKARMGQIDGALRELAASEPAAQAAQRVMAEVRARRDARLPERKWLTTTLAALTMMIAAFVFIWKAQERRNETERAFLAAAAIGSWRSPTQGLLRSSTDRWLKAPPHLGDYFYQLNTDAPEKKRANP